MKKSERHVGRRPLPTLPFAFAALLPEPEPVRPAVRFQPVTLIDMSQNMLEGDTI